MEALKNEHKQSYLSGLVASVVSIALKLLVTMFSFSNRALNHDRDFDLSNADDNDQVDKHLADSIGMKQKYSGNKGVLKFLDYGNGKQASLVKVPTTTNYASFWKSSVWLGHAANINSSNGLDKSSCIRHMTKDLLRSDQNAIQCPTPPTRSGCTITNFLYAPFNRRELCVSPVKTDRTFPCLWSHFF